MRLLSVLIGAIGFVTASDVYGDEYNDNYPSNYDYQDSVNANEPTIGGYEDQSPTKTPPPIAATELYNIIENKESIETPEHEFNNDPTVSLQESPNKIDDSDSEEFDQLKDLVFGTEKTTDADELDEELTRLNDELTESEVTEETEEESFISKHTNKIGSKIKGVWVKVSDKTGDVVDDVFEFEGVKWAANVHTESSKSFLEGFNDVKGWKVFDKNADHGELAKGSLGSLLSGLKCTGIGMVSFFFIPFVWIPIFACTIVWIIITLSFKCCCGPKKEPESEENPDEPEEEDEDEPEDDAPGDENDAFNPEDKLNSDEEQAVNLASKAIDAELTLTEVLSKKVKSCGKWFWITLAAIWLISGISIGCSMCTLATCSAT